MKARGARGRKVTVMAESAAHRDARRTAPRRSTAPPACRASLWASEQRVSRASSQQSSESAEQASGGWGGGPRAETRHTRGRAGWGGVPHSEAVYAAGLALLAGCLREPRTLQASRGCFTRGEVPREVPWGLWGASHREERRGGRMTSCRSSQRRTSRCRPSCAPCEPARCGRAPAPSEQPLTRYCAALGERGGVPRGSQWGAHQAHHRSPLHRRSMRTVR